jgi:hypothetical protein
MPWGHGDDPTNAESGGHGHDHGHGHSQ